MPVKREVTYAEKGLKLLFYSECGMSDAEEDPSFLARRCDDLKLGPRFFELQFDDDSGLGMPFEMAQGVARAIVGKPVHGKKGWLLVTDGKFSDEGKPIYECRWGDRLLYNENGITLHTNDENGISGVGPFSFSGALSQLGKRLRTRRFRQAGPEYILTIGRHFVGISSATAAALAAAIVSKRTDVTN